MSEMVERVRWHLWRHTQSESNGLSDKAASMASGYEYIRLELKCGIQA